ncbi:MAG: hypothetical protein V7724_01230 [Sediminicola sp.]
MKKIVLFMALCLLMVIVNCAKIAENNDPVIGIWSYEAQAAKTALNTSRQEWIFNDAYLGRYHSYEGSKIKIQTDFKWSQTDGIYTISYPGTSFEDDIVTMEESSTSGQLVLLEKLGGILAVRE